MNKKALMTIFIIVLTDIMGYGIVIPLLPQIAIDFKMNGLMLGLLMVVFPLAQFFSAPILGGWSDRIGRKPILIISKAGTVLSYLLFAVAGNYWLILLSKIIDGITGGNIPAARAYISDHTEPAKRAKGMAIIGVSFGIGLVIGPIIGGATFMIGNNKFWPGIIGAIFCLISMFLTIFLLEEDSSKFVKKEKRKPVSINVFRWLKKVDVRKILIIQLIVTMVFSAYQNSLIFFAVKIFAFGPSENSRLLALVGIFSILVQGGLLQVKSFSPRKSVYFSIILSSFTLILIGANSNISLLYLLIPVISLGNGLLAIYLPTWLSTRSEKDPEGELMGAFESFGSVGRIIGPAISGIFVNYYPRQVFFGMGSILILLTLVLGRHKMGTLPKITRNEQ
jgi:DHA1 family tetracycline resistance protein-like MFS transporter